jgi:hypothetical protein
MKAKTAVWLAVIWAGFSLAAAAHPVGSRANQRLSPQIRIYPNTNEIAPIPLDAIYPFLYRPEIVSNQQINRAPYVVSSFDGHLVVGPDNLIYVRGPIDPAVTRFAIFRTGKIYYENGTQEQTYGVMSAARVGRGSVDQSRDLGPILGFEALDIGEAELLRVGDPSTLRVIRTQREILAGDRLMPLAEVADPSYVPRPPVRPVNGRIVGVVNGLTQVGRPGVVVINRGSMDGLQPGNVLNVYQSGGFARDRIGSYGGGQVRMPDEQTGDMLVFRTFDRLSYGLIMDSERPVHIYDIVRADGDDRGLTAERPANWCRCGDDYKSLRRLYK